VWCRDVWLNDAAPHDARRRKSRWLPLEAADEYRGFWYSGR
jgi:hypothetical protein